MSGSGIARSILFFPGRGEADPAVAETPPAEDGVLVERVCAGDQDAFDELYKRVSPMVHGIILARVPHIEVDDLVQDVFLTAYCNLDSLRDRSAFGAWIASIARRRSVEYFRRSKRTEELAPDLKAEYRPIDEAREALAAMRDLPDAYSETLILRLVEGMTGPEIAEATGLTPDSVRVNLHRGMKLLKKRLGVRE